VHKNSPRFHAFFFLDVSEITSQLIDRDHGRLSLFAFDHDCLIVPVQQDHVGAGTVTERQFTNFERRMNACFNSLET
jgi:hypothetical protein